MSTRTLLELLAGKMPIDEFTKSYSPDARTTINPFMQRLQIGQLITAVSVQRICWMGYDEAELLSYSQLQIS